MMFKNLIRSFWSRCELDLKFSPKTLTRFCTGKIRSHFTLGGKQVFAFLHPDGDPLTPLFSDFCGLWHVMCKFFVQNKREYLEL